MTPKSKRGFPLIWTFDPGPGFATLTAELYVKWYELYLVADTVLVVPFDVLEGLTRPGESAYIDHVPNPHCIERLLEASGYRADPLFLEMAHGRWLLECSP